MPAATQIGSASYWRQVLRNFDFSTPRFAKQAELGGDGQDSSFESAFANLAYAYIRDKAPSLLDYAVGFQMLERSQDNRRAVGVMGFKAGGQWLYAPVFFLSGDLKGHELLYMKNQDQFVPMKENWLNYLLNRRPSILGHGVDRNTRRLGVYAPDLQSLQVSPNYKMASWIVDVLPALAHAATDALGKPISLDLPGFVRKAGVPAVRYLQKVASYYPQIAAHAERFHGQALVDAIGAVEKQARSVLQNESIVSANTQPKVTGSVLTKQSAADTEGVSRNGNIRIISKDLATFDPPPTDISEEERNRLLRDGVLVKDLRKGEEVSVAYNVMTEQVLTNPSESGLYEVLTKPGVFERCYVQLWPCGPIGTEPYAVIFRADTQSGDKNWMNTHPRNIWIGSKIEGKEFDKWWDSLPAVTEKLPASQSRYAIIGPQGQGTCIFRIQKSRDDGDVASYDVDFARDFQKPQGFFSKNPSNQDSWQRDDAADYSSYRDGERIYITGKKGTKLRVVRGTIFVPEGYKLVQVRKETEEERKRREKVDEMCDTPEVDSRQQSDPAPLHPGNLADVQLNLVTKMAALQIYHNGNEVEINRRRMSPMSAFVHLIRDHGFSEKQSTVMLKEAQLKGKRTYRVKYANWVKQSALVGPLGEGPGAPAIPDPNYGADPYLGSGVPTQMGFEEELRVPGMERATGRQSMLAEPDRQAMQTAEQAAGTGQKEIFDTAVIGGMLKRVREDSMIDAYLGDLMKGLDRIGRILLLFYWHNDDFADRYGKDDMPELEDTLRNTFESLGDLVIYLQKRSIQPLPDDTMLGHDLTDSSGD